MSEPTDTPHHPADPAAPVTPDAPASWSLPPSSPGITPGLHDAPTAPTSPWADAPPSVPPTPWGAAPPAPSPTGEPPSWGAPAVHGYAAPVYGAPVWGPPAGPPPPPGAPVGGAPQGPNRSVGVAFGLAGLAVVLAVAFLFVALLVRAGDGDDSAVPVTDADPATTTTLPGGRLAPEPPIPTTDGPHEFFNVERDGDPVAWDPCNPIHYVVNDGRAPEGAMAILDDAIAQIEQATGLVFVDDGPTDEMAPVGEQERPDSDPGRYGDGWSPVLISWTDAMADPELDGAAGLASPSYRQAASGELVYVTGYVEMAGDYAADLIERGGRDDVLGIMMHELGHLVGLGHVEPSDQVMTDDPNSTPSVWGNGDLVGLAMVGRGECEPDL